MKFAARIFPIFLFLIAFLFFLKPLAFAQQTTPTNVNPDVPNNLHTWTQNVMIEVTSSLSCLITGIDPINPNGKCLGVDSKTHKIGYIEKGGGAIGVMGNLIAMTFTPPAHTRDYVNYLAGNFGLTKPTYAAVTDQGDQGGGGSPQQKLTGGGIGFQSLSPLTNIWVQFRNLTYLLFVLIFLIIGFAIMFRVHIDPRTVMTIENQIPKIIIGLILVTFSFAIAGLLIDLMWILIYLSINIFSSIPGVTVGDSFQKVQGLNAMEVANNISGGIFGIASTSSAGVGGFIAGLLNGPGGSILAAIMLGAAGAGLGILGGGIGIAIGALIGGVVGGLTGSAALGLVGSVIAFLVIAIALLFSLIRLWFSLIKAYVMILIVIVFAPFWILAGLIPGSKLTFESWLREVGGNLIAFPVTIIMFLLGKTFIDIFSGPTANSAFVPPLIGNPGDTSAIGAIIGLGFILLSADAVKLSRAALKAPDFDFKAIFGAIGAGQKVLGGTVSNTASSIFVATQGTLKADEKGLGAIARRMFR